MATKRARGNQIADVEGWLNGLKALGLKVPGQAAPDESGRYGRMPRKAIPPPLGEDSLSKLLDVVEESATLKQCIVAYETNIEGFGYRLDPLSSDDEEAESVEETSAQRKEYQRLMQFFQYCYPEGSFIDLRRRVRYDTEGVGNGYIEVIRDTGAERRIQTFNYVQGHTIRLTVQDPEVVDVTERRLSETGEIEEAKTRRRFRTYVQIVEVGSRTEKVWFKEFGDPRALDSKTGEFGQTSLPATELMMFKAAHFPKSPYGVPRWLGNLPAVLGTRAAEEVNLTYFDNKAVPPLVVLVSGGALTKESVRRLKETIDSQIKGRENFHRILLLEAQTTQTAATEATSTAPRVDLKPMTEAQAKDALFMGYDEANSAKVRASFRLPPILIGRSDDYTRATASASLAAAEEQVFRPERVSFDYRMNRWVMPDLGARYHAFCSIGPNVTDDASLISAMEGSEKSGGMTPNISRRILGDVFQMDLPKIEEPWGDLPFTMTIAQTQAAAQALLGLGPDGLPPAAGGEQPPGGRPAGEEPPADGGAPEPGEGAEDYGQRGAGTRMSQQAGLWARFAERMPRPFAEAMVERMRRQIREELARRGEVGE